MNGNVFISLANGYGATIFVPTRENLFAECDSRHLDAIEFQHGNHKRNIGIGCFLSSSSFSVISSSFRQCLYAFSQLESERKEIPENIYSSFIVGTVVVYTVCLCMSLSS